VVTVTFPFSGNVRSVAANIAAQLPMRERIAKLPVGGIILGSCSTWRVSGCGFGEAGCGCHHSGPNRRQRRFRTSSGGIHTDLTFDRSVGVFPAPSTNDKFIERVVAYRSPSPRYPGPVTPAQLSPNRPGVQTISNPGSLVSGLSVNRSSALKSLSSSSSFL